MPVPQTFTSGALGLATKWSASSMTRSGYPDQHISKDGRSLNVCLLVDVQLVLPNQGSRC